VGAAALGSAGNSRRFRSAQKPRSSEALRRFLWRRLRSCWCGTSAASASTGMSMAIACAMACRTDMWRRRPWWSRHPSSSHLRSWWRRACGGFGWRCETPHVRRPQRVRSIRHARLEGSVSPSRDHRAAVPRHEDSGAIGAGREAIGPVVRRTNSAALLSRAMPPRLPSALPSIVIGAAFEGVMKREALEAVLLSTKRECFLSAFE